MILHSSFNFFLTQIIFRSFVWVFLFPLFLFYAHSCVIWPVWLTIAIFQPPKPLVFWKQLKDDDQLQKNCSHWIFWWFMSWMNDLLFDQGERSAWVGVGGWWNLHDFHHTNPCKMRAEQSCSKKQLKLMNDQSHPLWGSFLEFMRDVWLEELKKIHFCMCWGIPKFLHNSHWQFVCETHFWQIVKKVTKSSEKFFDTECVDYSCVDALIFTLT